MALSWVDILDCEYEIERSQIAGALTPSKRLSSTANISIEKQGKCYVCRKSMLHRTIPRHIRTVHIEGASAVAQALVTSPRDQPPPHALEMVLLAYPAVHLLVGDTGDSVQKVLRSSQNQFLRLFAKLVRTGTVFGSYRSGLEKAVQLLQEESSANAELH